MSNLGDVLRQVVCTPKHIPDDWQFYKLTDICNPKQWKTISATEMTESGYPVFGANGFVGFYHEYNHEHEAVAITCRGNTCGTINRIPSKTYITGNSMALDDIKRNVITQDFLYYALKYRGVGDSISGSAQPQITGAGLRSIEFPAPPLHEQQKIATILSSVDDVIEKTRAQIDKLKDLKTAMMQELLTKGIGHTEFKDSPVGRIPITWHISELIEYLSYISYGFTNPMPESDKGPFMVTAKDINGLAIQYLGSRKTTQEAFNDLLTEKSRPKINDVLLTKDGTLGRVALVDRSGVCINQSVAVLRPNEKILPKFLLYLLAAPSYQREMLDKAGGSTIKHIYITVVDKMKVAVPELTEQKKIVDALDALISKILLSEVKLIQYTGIKKALMQDLLTGKVRVNLTDKESAVV